MEKKNLKGQVLSEKEMREVKGGEFNDNITNPHAEDLICENCGNPLIGTFVYNSKTRLYSCFCSVCGTEKTIDSPTHESVL